MREILFRGKRRDNGKWHYGSYLYLKNAPSYDWTGKESGKREDIHFIIDESDLNYSVDPKTVCQYTGLTDKNGRKIFEGDIVKRTDLHATKEPSVGLIEYDAENTSFLIHWTDIENYSATFPWKDRIEVIGNIFDNPELLKGAQYD